MTAQLVADHQGYCQHKFHYYRNGLPRHDATEQEIADGANAGDAENTLRWADIIARTAALPGLPVPGFPGMVIPAAGNFQFTNNHRDRLKRIAVANRTRFNTAQTVLGTTVMGREAREAVQEEYTSAYKLMRSSFRYVKCLGWGGDGIVSQWRYSPGPGQEHSVVMKMSNQSELGGPTGRTPQVVTQFLDQERDTITKLGRAPHIVQRFYTAHYPRLNPPGATKRSARTAAAVADMAQKIDGDQGSYFLMETCKFGNLEAQLQRAAKDMPNGSERYLDEPVLWRFFDCLVKACMAMEEPPRFNPANGAIPLSTQGGYLPETITPGNPGREGIVHIDFDPTNVFIYGYDPPNPAVPIAPAHTTLPRLQVGDFGYAQNEASLWADARDPTLGPAAPSPAAEWTRRLRRWQLRHDGKAFYALPEQFGKDWDRIPFSQDSSDDQQLPWMVQWMPPWMAPWAPPPPITTGPGRYSSASNVWQMGMVLKVCMTLRDPDLPPYAGRMNSEEPANPTPDQERWTYGWSLLDPAEPWTNMYQQALINLVARCLMAKQAHRPTLQQIQAIITAQLALPANQNVNAYWTNTFFSDPPPPRPPVDTENVNDIDPFWDYRNRTRL